MIQRWIRLFFRKGHDRPRTRPEETDVTHAEAPMPDSTAATTVAGEALVTHAAEADAGASEPCPACGADVDLPSDVELGEILHCAHCGAEVEVISRDPLRLDLFEEEEK